MAKTIVAGLTVAAVFAIAQIDLKRSESGAEASAIGSLRAISSAQAIHAGAYGAYARSLRALSTPCPGVSTGFVSPDLGRDPAIKVGYEIRLHPAPPSADRRDCHGEPMATGYHATAVPMQRSGGAARGAERRGGYRASERPRKRPTRRCATAAETGPPYRVPSGGAYRGGSAGRRGSRRQR
jgi:hypothetical protein